MLLQDGLGDCGQDDDAIGLDASLQELGEVDFFHGVRGVVEDEEGRICQQEEIGQ